MGNVPTNPLLDSIELGVFEGMLRGLNNILCGMGLAGSLRYSKLLILCCRNEGDECKFCRTY